MSLSRSLRRQRQRINHKKNQQIPQGQHKLLFEALEPRFILSADLTNALASQSLSLDLKGAAADQVTVAPPEAAGAAPLSQIESSPTGPTGEDEPENNSRIDATLLPLTEDPLGSGLFLGRGAGRQDPAINNTNWSDPDYWRIEVLANDIVSISVDTPGSALNPYVEFRNAADSTLGASDDHGPDNDAYISHYTIPSSGSYYVLVGKNYYETTPNNYEVRVEVARGIQQENDWNYRNDNISSADALTLTAAGTHLRATVAGTVMGPESSNTDEDYFSLGVLNVGNTVELDLRQPSGSTINGRVTLVDSSGAAVADTDGSALDDHFLGTIAADGAYYAKVESLWGYNGHTYLVTAGMNWTQAEAEAVAKGGHLVTVNDAAEQTWLTQTFAPYSRTWIGFTDQALENTWRWADGTATGYTNWATGHPYINNTSYNWAYQGSGGQWYTAYDSYTSQGVVELTSPGTGGVGAGPQAQYLLDVDITDTVPPRITALSGLPANGTTTDDPQQSFSLTFSEAMDAATVNAGNRMVWSYGGHFYTLTNSSVLWTAAETEAVNLGGHLATVNDARGAGLAVGDLRPLRQRLDRLQ